jgi:hypothetical protein
VSSEQLKNGQDILKEGWSESRRTVPDRRSWRKYGRVPATPPLLLRDRGTAGRRPTSDLHRRILSPSRPLSAKHPTPFPAFRSLAFCCCLRSLDRASPWFPPDIPLSNTRPPVPPLHPSSALYSLYQGDVWSDTVAASCWRVVMASSDPELQAKLRQLDGELHVRRPLCVAL